MKIEVYCHDRVHADGILRVQRNQGGLYRGTLTPPPCLRLFGATRLRGIKSALHSIYRLADLTLHKALNGSSCSPKFAWTSLSAHFISSDFLLNAGRRPTPPNVPLF